MSNATKFLLLAFSLGITCLLIVYFKQVVETGLKTTETAKEKMDQFNISLSESDITMYDGYDVTGSDVVNFIKKNLGCYDTGEKSPMYVNVRTSTSANIYYNGASLVNIQNFTSTLYIKPVAVFTCTVARDANEVIIGLNFVQR